MFSLCVLHYGDHVSLAQRCWGSILRSLGSSPTSVADVRMGANKPTPQMLVYLQGVVMVRLKELGIRSRIYHSPDNRFKYPTMRRMFYDPSLPLAEHVMWFDDDSYLQPDISADWWEITLAKAQQADMVGQHWFSPFNWNLCEFIKKQPWFNGKPFPLKYKARFCQGAWWTAKSSMLGKWDWPIEQLRHCGGDSMLGELIRQQDYTMLEYDKYVAINADALGNKSMSPRRGYSEENLGRDYRSGAIYPTAHQEFDCNVFDSNQLT